MIVTLCSLTSVFGQEVGVANPELAKFIDSLAVEDQRPYVRVRKGEITPEQAEKDFRAATRSNHLHLKKIVKQYGFPSFRFVGKSSSHNFWMMVQHSDFDVPFQKKVLRLMRKRLKEKDASAQDYAFLVDRVRVNTKRLQLYGTQIIVVDVTKGYQLKPVHAPAKLNARRKKIGLPSVEEYLEKANKVFFELNKDRIKRS